MSSAEISGGTDSAAQLELERTVAACLDNLGTCANTLIYANATLRPDDGPNIGRDALLEALGSDALLVEGTLGEGGMGVVYLATQTSLGRKEAVKKLRPQHRSPQTTLKLLRE